MDGNFQLRHLARIEDVLNLEPDAGEKAIAGTYWAAIDPATAAYVNVIILMLPFRTQVLIAFWCSQTWRTPAQISGTGRWFQQGLRRHLCLPFRHGAPLVFVDMDTAGEQ